jgi:hypothetical protein
MERKEAGRPRCPLGLPAFRPPGSVLLTKTPKVEVAGTEPVSFA